MPSYIDTDWNFFYSIYSDYGRDMSADLAFLILEWFEERGDTEMVGKFAESYHAVLDNARSQNLR